MSGVSSPIRGPKTVGRRFLSLMIDQETFPEVTDFLAELTRQETAPLTIKTYASDLRAFARWFSGSSGESFSSRSVTPTDLRAV